MKYVEKPKPKKTVIDEAIELWGENQLDLLIEEMSELTQAICKRKRNREHNIPEEIADVLIVIEQVSKLLEIETEVELERVSKIRLLKQKIAIEKEKRNENI